MRIVSSIMSNIQSSTPAASSVREGKAQRESVSVNIHLVDDDMAVRDSLDALLSIHGFTVYTHSSAAAFLLSSSLACDCLVLDVQMP